MSKRKAQTIADAFDLLFDKDMFSLIETKVNEKIKRIEALTKHKENLFESSKYLWIKPIDLLNYVHWLVCFIIVVSMEWTTTVCIFYLLIKQVLQYSVLQCLVTMKFWLSTLTFDNPEEHKEK